MDTLTIWIIERATETVALCDIHREDLPKYRLVMAQADGEHGPTMNSTWVNSLY